MGQTLCNVDQKKLDQQAQQLPTFNRQKIKHERPPTINSAILSKSEERIQLSENAIVSSYSDIHLKLQSKKIIEPSIDKNQPQYSFAVPFKQQIILPQPVQEQIQKLGDYSYEGGEAFPRGTMVNQIFKLENGIKYIGQWKQGKVHGQGQYVLQDGSYLQAYSVSNQISGGGRLINSNGDYYEGQLKQNKANGQGHYQQNNIVYQGEFLNNRPHGKGTQKGQSFQYSGLYENGMKTQGKLRWKNERGEYQYQGYFKDNELNGNGTLIANGKRIQGVFVNGKLSGPAS